MLKEIYGDEDVDEITDELMEAAKMSEHASSPRARDEQVGSVRCDDGYLWRLD
jgi:hypothetical protein